jgi:hypothetical protein
MYADMKAALYALVTGEEGAEQLAEHIVARLEAGA